MYKDIFDRTMKKLFHISSRPLIDMINALYDEKLSNEAKIRYDSNEFVGNDLCILRGDIFLVVDDGGKIRRLHIEFQTLNDRTMVLRMFDYGYKKAVEMIDDYHGETIVRMPEQRVIFLEKDKKIPDELKMKIEFSDGQNIIFKVPVIKYGEYDIMELYRKNLYVLLPLYIIKYRNGFNAINKGYKRINRDREKLIDEKYKELKNEIKEILEMMDGLLEKGKITLEDYNLMATAIENLAVYLYGRYIKGNKISKEVSNMVKTFIDPKMVIVYKTEGKAEGKAEDIIELLEDKGNISEKLLEKVKQEMDVEVLRRWVKLAARVETVEEFERKIGKS